MQSKAQAKWIRMSPRKVRRVVNEIRGKSCSEAVTILRFMPFSAAREVEKVLRSAMFNLINAEKAPITEAEANELKVVEAYADQGPTLKRIQPRARGRAYPILKKSSHITVVVSDV
ncbi:MAG: 50S ribosomal protein L22 [Candidatus Obscuribacterales bacterium]|nr:50S ribosomal protein L22 [Cyanobacteria bacterium SZAS LIN-5]RTL44981.1 MAG: 50S ribosomal protein L22 [Candidatus Melainabacteria bacterium]